MAISSWPAAERPRERLLERGAGYLTDAELVAVLLRTGIRGKNAVELARELLETFGGITGMLAAKLGAVKGLGPAKRAQLAAALELARRALGEELKAGALLTSHDKVLRQLRAQNAVGVVVAVNGSVSGDTITVASIQLQ